MAKGMRPLDAPDLAARFAVSEDTDVTGMGPPVSRRTLAVPLAAPVPAALTACVHSEFYWPFDAGVPLLQATASPSCMDSRVWVQRLTRTTGYTSPVNGCEA